jgi:hypothetical protein
MRKQPRRRSAAVSRMSLLERRSATFHQGKRWISRQRMALLAGRWLTCDLMSRTRRHDLDAKIVRFRYRSSKTVHLGCTSRACARDAARTPWTRVSLPRRDARPISDPLLASGRNELCTWANGSGEREGIGSVFMQQSCLTSSTFGWEHCDARVKTVASATDAAVPSRSPGVA